MTFTDHERELLNDPSMQLEPVLETARDALMHSTHPQAHPVYDELGTLQALLLKLWRNARDNQI